MTHAADRLIACIRKKANPCVVGLDPRIGEMPAFATDRIDGPEDVEGIRDAIVHYHRLVLDEVAPLIPAVKPQSAFYEQYGMGGLLALQETIRMARERDLFVILDAKRNDIASTAQAYANTFLGQADVPGGAVRAFDSDYLTVSPFLGWDTVSPFADTCAEHGKGLFILVKTSNPGSSDLQDLTDQATGKKVYELLAESVADLASKTLGASGYSPIGAVVGATYPEEAVRLRELMPQSIFLVPGYGAQGGTGESIARCFNPDGLGAVVSSSRGITYALGSLTLSESEVAGLVRDRTQTMVADIVSAVERRMR
ncbi:MAG: orotidine-5'-phosphate decarboxylase [bacterium]|nr:orotidine-5'-phosphate decarboxylase [bacterium]